MPSDLLCQFIPPPWPDLCFKSEQRQTPMDQNGAYNHPSFLNSATLPDESSKPPLTVSSTTLLDQGDSAKCPRTIPCTGSHRVLSSQIALGRVEQPSHHNSAFGRLHENESRLSGKRLMTTDREATANDLSISAGMLEFAVVLWHGAPQSAPLCWSSSSSTNASLNGKKWHSDWAAGAVTNICQKGTRRDEQRHSDRGCSPRGPRWGKRSQKGACLRPCAADLRRPCGSGLAYHVASSWCASKVSPCCLHYYRIYYLSWANVTRRSSPWIQARASQAG